MTVRGRKRKRMGPLVLNFTSDGFMNWRLSSWGLKIGRWSWSARTGRQRLDIPGPWTWTSKNRNRRTKK